MNFLHKKSLDIEIEDSQIYLVNLISQLTSLSQKSLLKDLKKFPKQFFFFKFIKKEILLNYFFLFIKKKSNILLNNFFGSSASKNQKKFFGFLIKIYTKSPLYLRFILNTFFLFKNFVFSLKFLTSMFRNVQFKIGSPTFSIWSFFIYLEKIFKIKDFFYNIDIIRTTNCHFCPFMRTGKYHNRDFFGKILFKIVSLIIINHRNKVICREQKYNLFKSSLKAMISFIKAKKQWLNISFMASQEDRYCVKFFSIDNFIFSSFQIKKLDYIKNIKLNFFCFFEKKVDLFYRLKFSCFSNKQFFKNKKNINLMKYKFNENFYGIYLEKMFLEKFLYIYINFKKKSFISVFKKEFWNIFIKPKKFLLITIKIYSEKVKKIKDREIFFIFRFSFFFKIKTKKTRKLGKKLTLYNLTNDILLLAYTNFIRFFLSLNKLNKKSFFFNFLPDMRKFLKILKKTYSNFDLWNFIKINFFLQ